MIRFLLKLADAARHRARRGRVPEDEAAGRRGEDLAHRFLEERGFRVVARNYRTHTDRGEIDLVAWDGETLVFVEVKSRHSGEYGAPERNVGREKRLALVRAARDYVRRSGVPWSRVRFDIVAVILSKPASLTHFKDAFRLEATL